MVSSCKQTKLTPNKHAACISFNIKQFAKPFSLDILKHELFTSMLASWQSSSSLPFLAVVLLLLRIALPPPGICKQKQTKWGPTHQNIAPQQSESEIPQSTFKEKGFFQEVTFLDIQ